jgi:hypothetical protein
MSEPIVANEIGTRVQVTPDIFGSSSFWFWTALAVLCLVGTIVVTYLILHRSAPAPQKTRLAAIFKGMWPVLACLAAVILASVFFLKAAGNVPPTDPFSAALSLGFVASLFEDILFFTFLGFVALFVQQTEFFRTRKLDERIDYLFNAKRLTSEELTYLKEKVAEIACDFRAEETTVDVIAYDEANAMVQIDVTRRFRVANYLKEKPAYYDWKMEILADVMPDGRASMSIFPPVTTLFQEKPDGSLIPLGDAKGLKDQIVEIPSKGGAFEMRDNRLPIGPQQVRECRSRFVGWQPLLGDDGKPDSYRLQVERHWDRICINVVNSLQRDVAVSIGSPDKAVRLTAGDHAASAWAADNVEAGREIFIEFSVPPPYLPKTKGGEALDASQQESQDDQDQRQDRLT